MSCRAVTTPLLLLDLGLFAGLAYADLLFLVIVRVRTSNEKSGG